VKLKGQIEKMAFEDALAQTNQLRNRVENPSPLSRLAIVLFGAGVALLIIAILDC
jgi:hypothetical protein